MIYHTSRKDQGFSLLEIAIFLTLSSAVLYMSINIGTNLLDEYKLQITYKKIEVIDNAMIEYYKLYNALPCPADRSLNINNIHYGMGKKSGMNSCINVLSNHNDSIGTGYKIGNVYQGGIPTKDLGIDSSMAIDGWKRDFTYTIDKNFLNENGFINNNIDGKIFIYEEYVNNNNAPKISDIMYTIMSHGSSGHGAFKNQKMVNYKSNNTFRDIFNANSIELNGGNTVFIPRFISMKKNFLYPDITSPLHKRSIFDDIVIYKNKYDF